MIVSLLKPILVLATRFLDLRNLVAKHLSSLNYILESLVPFSICSHLPFSLCGCFCMCLSQLVDHSFGLYYGFSQLPAQLPYPPFFTLLLCIAYQFLPLSFLVYRLTMYSFKPLLFKM